jgi:hypothetical protein
MSSSQDIAENNDQKVAASPSDEFVKVININDITFTIKKDPKVKVKKNSVYNLVVILKPTDENKDVNHIIAEAKRDNPEAQSASVLNIIVIYDSDSIEINNIEEIEKNDVDSDEENNDEDDQIEVETIVDEIVLE